jgi:hypothetical protein
LPGLALVAVQSVSGRLVIVTCEDWNGSTWNSNVITIAAPI